MWQEYLLPETVDEALHLLADRAGQARVIAGGTDLVLKIKRSGQGIPCLVDISRIGALKTISKANRVLTLGAAVTHAEIIASPLVRAHAPLLAQAAAEVGSPEIRNMGTVGGNVVNAQPAADAALALLALDAETEIASTTGTRWVPLADLYKGVGASVVDSTAELVKAFRFRSTAGQVGAAYRRLGKCKSIALPVLCAATIVQLEGDRFTSAAIALGPVAPRPSRAGAAEAWLVGQPVTADTIARAAAIAQESADPRDSLLRCSKEYRESMVAVLVRSTLAQAVAAAARPVEATS